MNAIPEAHSLSSTQFPATETPQEKLRFLLHFAVLAPSSHNSQPWQFRFTGDQVELIADRSRALPVIEPQDRELILSCGAVLGHLQTALRRFGYAGAVETFPDPNDRDLLVRVGLGANHVPDEQDEHLFQSLFARHTNRRPFREERIAPEIVATFDGLINQSGVWLHIVAEGERRETLANLIAHADREQVADCRFRRELAHWIRTSTGVQSSGADGIPAVALGMPGLIADVGPFLVRTFDAGALFAARDRQLAINSPLLAVLGTDEDTPEAWLAAGQALSHLLLATTAQGIASSFLNAPIEVPELRACVEEAAGHAGWPQLILRLGYGDPPAPTPRRPITEVLVMEEIPTYR